MASPFVGGSLAPAHQSYLLEARQMQALSFVVHIPLVCFAIAFPVMALGLLFRLYLHGRFDPDAVVARAAVPARAMISASASGLLARCAVACLIVGFGTLTIANAAWAHAIGVVCLFAFVVLGFLAFEPAELAAEGES